MITNDLHISWRVYVDLGLFKLDSEGQETDIELDRFEVTAAEFEDEDEMREFVEEWEYSCKFDRECDEEKEYFKYIVEVETDREAVWDYEED